MAVNQITRSFKDISLSFTPHPITGDLPVLRNENAIKRSIKNLVQTKLTERFFNPTVGSEISNFLFDFVDVGSSALIAKQIEITIENYEPRVENIKVEVSPLEDENSFDITVFFDIVGQDFPLQQFNFILEATR